MSRDLVDNMNDAIDALCLHCGYDTKRRLFPIMDSREHYWCVDAGERTWCKSSPKREAIETFLRDVLPHDDGDYPELFGDCFYSSEIYTRCDLPRGVFRGPVFTMVLENPESDGNLWLAVYRTEREVRLG